MKINLNDKLVEELDSIFDNKRTNQTDWDVCIEDIVEEFIARQNETWEDLPYEEDDEPDEVYFDLRNIDSSDEKKNKLNGVKLTQPPFKKKDNLRNRLDDK